MALVSIVALLLFCHLPLLNSAEETRKNSNTRPICPALFQCKDFGEFSFPFNNSTDWRCGLLKLNCSQEVPQLQLSEEGQLYDVRRFVDRDAIEIYDRVFQGLLDKRECDSLTNLSFPNSPSISFSLLYSITVFKCLKTSNLTGKREVFGDHYYNYSNCNEHNFYYRYPIDNLPNPPNFPDDCSVIQLPLSPENFDRAGKDASELFRLLTAEFTLKFHVDYHCHKCQSRGGQCQNDKGKFHCANAKEEKGKRSLTLILVTVIPGAFLIICLVIIIIWRRKTWSKLSIYFLPRKTSSDVEDGSSYYGVPVFSYKDLEEATHNFDPSKELGDGGFGTVYHGKLRDGREVAVKRLYEHNYKRVQQFMNEIDILTRLRHRNLVLLYGSTSHHSRKLLLVYEYIPNGTVADHLHGEKATTEPLTWPVRMNIAIDTASALSYLHKSDIIHRDVKTNNILLDNNFCVKVADFGLSRLFPTDATHVSTAPQGTPGYVDPEYHQCYQLTDKSDVYSFGVVLIELISSLPAVDISRQRNEINLANLAIDRIQRCAFDELIDPSLGHESDANIERMITSMAELAFRCLQLEKDLRPTMDEVSDCLRQIQGVDVSRSGMQPP